MILLSLKLLRDEVIICTRSFIFITTWTANQWVQNSHIVFSLFTKSLAIKLKNGIIPLPTKTSFSQWENSEHLNKVDQILSPDQLLSFSSIFLTLFYFQNAPFTQSLILRGEEKINFSWYSGDRTIICEKYARIGATVFGRTNINKEFWKNLP